MSAMSVVPKCARDVGEVGGFGALTERSDEALGPGGDHRDDEEERPEVGEPLPDRFEPGWGGGWGGEGGRGWHGQHKAMRCRPVSRK